MNRRAFFKVALSGLVVLGGGSKVWAGVLESLAQHAAMGDYFKKMENFDRPHPADVYLDSRKGPILKSTFHRLQRLQKTVGYGNFHLLGFDDAVGTSRTYSQIGDFTRTEFDFIEWLFYEDAAMYGFLGEKPLPRLTDQIRVQEVVRVPGTAHYLFKGRPTALYDKLRGDVGEPLILTSGVRSIVKQMYLFLNKTIRSRGNLSMASRSLAPPGFSFHGIGDFDVGQVGFGAANFTARFAATEVYERLLRMGYVKLRYDVGNLFGVRFEPWHIRVDASMV